MAPAKGFRISALVITCLALTCISHAQQAAVESPAEMTPDATAVAADAPAIQAGGFLYIGQIVGDNVNIRSGPGEIWYPVSRFDKNQRVVVVAEKFGWCKIEPTKQCFSIISKDFVTLSENPGIDDKDTSDINFNKVIPAQITGTHVRVRAGSDKVAPENASEVQIKLDAGDTVQVIGQNQNFYKIIPPKDCYFWVAKEFVTRAAPADPQTQQQLREQAAAGAIADDDKIAEDISAALGDLPADQSPSDPTAPTKTQQLIAIAKAFSLEIKKPIEQRDFNPLRDQVAVILKDPDADAVKPSAERLNRHLLQAQTILDTWKQSKQQDQQLQLTLAEIDQKVQQLAAVESPPEKTDQDLVVKGKLALSAVFSKQLSNRRYLILDDNDQIIYYAVADRPDLNLNDWVEKKVSLVGWAEYDSFSKIRLLHVKTLVQLP